MTEENTTGGVSVTDVPSLLATAKAIDALVQEVRDHRKLYKDLNRDVSRAAAEHVADGQPGGIYHPPLEGLETLTLHIDKQLANLEESLDNSAKTMRAHAASVTHNESEAARKIMNAGDPSDGAHVDTQKKDSHAPAFKLPPPTTGHTPSQAPETIA